MARRQPAAAKNCKGTDWKTWGLSDDERGLMTACELDPAETTGWLVLADYWAEHGGVLATLEQPVRALTRMGLFPEQIPETTSEIAGRRLKNPPGWIWHNGSAWVRRDGPPGMSFWPHQIDGRLRLGPPNNNDAGRPEWFEVKAAEHSKLPHEWYTGLWSRYGDHNDVETCLVVCPSIVHAMQAAYNSWAVMPLYLRHNYFSGKCANFVKCPTCYGSGYWGEKRVPCHYCWGTGKWTDQEIV